MKGLTGRYFYYAYCFIVMLIPLRAFSSIQLSATRGIFYDEKPTITLTIKNANAYPTYVNGWVDSDDNVNIRQADSRHFSVTPRFYKMNPSATQLMYIALNKADRPKGRESVYYLNLLERAATSTRLKEDAYWIQHRIKLFYRPDGIGTPKLKQLVPQLIWQRINMTSSTFEIRCINPSPFYINIAVMGIARNGTISPLEKDVLSMVPPFSQRDYLVKHKKTERNYSPIELVIEVVDDFGGTNKFEVTVQ